MDARFWIAHPLLLARRTELQKEWAKKSNENAENNKRKTLSTMDKG